MEPHDEKYKKLVGIFLQLTDVDVQETSQLLEIFLEGALELVDAENGSIFKLDYQTGQLDVVNSFPESDLKFVDWGCGFVGRALKNEQPIIIDNLRLTEYRSIYIPQWKGMKSEMVIPIFLENIPVRVGTEIKKTGRRKIGVLNIESGRGEAFSDRDKELLMTLARYAAIRIADIESDLKLEKLRKKEEMIAKSGQDFHQIIESVIEAIIAILQFDMVNISLIDNDKSTIETRYIESKDLTDVQKQEFKRRAIHLLYPKGVPDIQADIIRNPKIDVPDANDPRFDEELSDDFGHEKLIRVFMPMIETDMAIGTVECGYKREFREFIYERDVQILEAFVNHATQALEKSRRNSIEMITHELRNPILGIRNHADTLSRRWKNGLREDQIDAKLDDILTDCAILFNQVGQLDEMEGGSRSSNIVVSNVSIYNEIIKILKQLRPLLRDRGFSSQNMNYQFSDLAKNTTVRTDQSRINQVIYNLLMNSIKYSEEDANRFKILIKVEQRSQEGLRIRFQDYGIGIKEKEKDLIFERGFRSNEAKKREQGSGMGLSTSRAIIDRLGGQLLLINFKNPTEFQLIIPDYIKD